MKTTLTPTPFLSSQQIGELASALVNTHTKVLKAIERLNNDVASKKTEISNRWKATHIDMVDRARLAEQDTIASVRTIHDNSKTELDRQFKEAGATYHKVVAQKIYYDSPVKVLSRLALGDARRSEYVHQLRHAGSAEIANIGQFAVGTGNAALATAVLSRLDAMPTNQRPFSAQELADSIDTEFTKVTEYFKITEARFQGIVLAIRTWNSGTANPINTVSLALRMRQIDQDILKELQDGEQ